MAGLRTPRTGTGAPCLDRHGGLSLQKTKTLDPFLDWIPDQSLSSTFVIGDRGQASGTSVEDDRGGGGEDDRYIRERGGEKKGRMRCGPYKEKEKETEGGEQTREFDYAQGVRYN